MNEDQNCIFGEKFRASQVEINKNLKERIENMDLWIDSKFKSLEDSIKEINNRIWLFAVPNILTLLGIVFLIIRLFYK